MSTDWRDGFADLRRETAGGVPFKLVLIPVWAMRSLLARRSDEDILVLQAIRDWSHTIEQAKRDDYHPGCVACGDEIATPTGIAGWMILIPTSSDTGLCGAFCPACHARGPEAIASMVMISLRDELGGEVVTVH